MNTRGDNTCAHCGADCGKHPSTWNNLIFCCNGCKTVYQLLNENRLYNYYEIEDSPGIKLETTEFGNKYAFLEQDEIREKLISFSEAGISKAKFYIPVIHCSSCIWLLENLHKINPSIKYSFVNFTKKEVDITFDETRISLRQVVELLSSIHYIPDLSFNFSEEEDTHSNKKLLYKLGVAGFVFINVMTYSLPAYFNGKPLEGNLQSLLSLLSYFLVIPVVFFSASDYFISTYKNIRKRNVSIDLPIALGITVLFLVSSYEILISGGQGYCDSLAGLIFFLLVGKWYQGKTYQALSFDRNYKSYFPIAVTKINKQIEESVLLENINVGDVLMIRNKELIPADSLIIDGEGRIDYSFVTGESSPVVKREGDLVYAGGRQTGEIIRVEVKKRVSQSHLTKLWNQDRSYEKPSDSLTSLSDRISRYFTLAIVSIAIAGFVFWMLRGDIHRAVFVFTAVLIVACPCALALSIPFTFGSTMRIFGKSGLYIKNASVIERLSNIDTIVFDKTGTLTRPNENRIDFTGTRLSEDEEDAIYSLAKQSTHPLSNAIVGYMPDASYRRPDHFVEVSGRGMFGRVGDIEIKIGSEEYVTNARKKKEQESSEVYVAVNNKLMGYYTISNQYRQGFEKVLELLKTNFSMYMVSGDNDSELKNLTGYFEKGNLLFNQSPEDKADFIKSIQDEGHNVLMTGDGLNDAGALMQSDVALTIADKVYHFSPASDAILEADQFQKLAAFISFTRTSIKIVKLSFLISFLYNIVGISYALSGNLSPIIAAILMPLSSVSVVAFATFITRAMARRMRS